MHEHAADVGRKRDRDAIREPQSRGSDHGNAPLDEFCGDRVVWLAGLPGYRAGGRICLFKKAGCRYHDPALRSGLKAQLLKAVGRIARFDAPLQAIECGQRQRGVNPAFPFGEQRQAAQLAIRVGDETDIAHAGGRGQAIVIGHDAAGLDRRNADARGRHDPCCRGAGDDRLRPIHIVEDLCQHQPAFCGEFGQPCIAIGIARAGQHHVQHHDLRALIQQRLGKVGNAVPAPGPWAKGGDACLIDVDHHHCLGLGGLGGELLRGIAGREFGALCDRVVQHAPLDQGDEHDCRQCQPESKQLSQQGRGLGHREMIICRLLWTHFIRITTVAPHRPAHRHPVRAVHRRSCRSFSAVVRAPVCGRSRARRCPSSSCP